VDTDRSEESLESARASAQPAARPHGGQVSPVIERDLRRSRGKAQGRQADGQEQPLYVGSYFSLVSTPDGWEYVQHNQAGSVVAVLGLVNETSIVLVRQYRPPVERAVLELPAGLAESDDFPHEAAREFAEETGREITGLSELYVAPVCAGLTSTWLRVYAGAVPPLPEAAPDRGELETVLVPFAALTGTEPDQALAGEVIEQTVYAAAFRFLSGHPSRVRGAP
jgi:8-oxo-dGTP pyrophosphatase MutT (NUDIX family)